MKKLLCKSKMPGKDFVHILRCPHQSRRKWRKDLLSSLKERCYTIKTFPHLVDFILDGIWSWFENQTIHPADYPAGYPKLLQQQETIGWIQFFQCPILMQWAQLQHDHYDGFPPIKGSDGTSWSRNILSLILSHWNLLWEDAHYPETRP
jgi:hypothetical protein